MPATAAQAAPPPPPRRRVYAAVDPRCEWANTENADTLVVDVSGFRKEELKVLYSTNRKLKVTGERQVDGAQWARFVKVFPVPRSCDAGAIRANMNLEHAQLSVVLPKRSPSSSPKDKQNEHQSMGEHHKEPENAGAASGSSSGRLYSAQEDVAADRVEEKERREDQGTEPQRQEALAKQDSSKRSDGGANAVKKDDDGDKGESNRWWRKIRVIHVLGFVLVLSLVGVGATLLYVMLL